MEIPLKPPQLDIQSLIHRMQSHSFDSIQNTKSKFFPYIETYGKQRNHEENLLMNKTIKFRENYMHNRTLRYMDPDFSYKQALKKIENTPISIPKPKSKEDTKPEKTKNSTLKEIISKTEFFLYKETHPGPYTLKNNRLRSQYPSKLSKIKKFKQNKVNYGRVSPDLLRVTNIAFKESRSRRLPTRNFESVNFYQHTQATNETQESHEIFSKARYTTRESPLKENSPKLTCDAVSNTDVIY